MDDRDMVIKSIENCLHEKGCDDCSYEGCIHAHGNCTGDLMADALELLKEQQETASEWLEDSDPGQVYGTTWACFKCKHGIHKPFVWNPYDSKMVYCPFCGARMYREVKQNAET